MGIDRHELEHRNWRPSGTRQPRLPDADVTELKAEETPKTAPVPPPAKRAKKKSKADA
ncbi:MAG: hypothetical protein J0G95_08460 [Rhizobiales bacterium]|nr:hypothetical protein [Hyphomicrobiales bacterium]